jgi:hypothetical protein
MLSFPSNHQVYHKRGVRNFCFASWIIANFLPSLHEGNLLKWKLVQFLEPYYLP